MSEDEMRRRDEKRRVEMRLNKRNKANRKVQNFSQD